MNSYCVKCRKDTENIDPKIEQKIIGLLSNLGIKTPWSKIPLLNVLFWASIDMYKNEWNCK